jgi:hypothetical protein
MPRTDLWQDMAEDEDFSYVFDICEWRKSQTAATPEILRSLNTI